MQDEESRAAKENIEKCIWKTDEFGKPNMAAPKIGFEVAADKDKEEFPNHFPGCFAYMPTRILNNCIPLPIEAESQDTVFRIFSTLNDRGKPLSDPRNLESLGNKALLEKRINIGGQPITGLKAKRNTTSAL